MVQLPIAANVHEDHGKRRIAGGKDPWTVCHSAVSDVVALIDSYLLHCRTYSRSAGHPQQFRVSEHVQPLTPCTLRQPFFSQALRGELNTFLRVPTL